jgi:hypothetical protein
MCTQGLLGRDVLHPASGCQCATPKEEVSRAEKGAVNVELLRKRPKDAAQAILNLKGKPVFASERSMPTYQTTLCRHSEDKLKDLHRYENLKFYIRYLVYLSK